MFGKSSIHALTVDTQSLMVKRLLAIPRRWRLVAVVVLFVFPLMLGSDGGSVARVMRDHLSFIYQPFVWVAEGTDHVTQWMRSRETLRQERQLLIQENERLYQWQARALFLEQENEQLRQWLPLLTKNERKEEWLLLPIMVDSGTFFRRTLLLQGGSSQGIRQNSAVRDYHGLLGYALEVGMSMTRVLLITDLNARVPVKMMPSNIHAILTGDNSVMPWLNFIENAEDETALDGDYVVTSGRGGVFPAGLAVGIVRVADEEQGDQIFRVHLLATPHKDSHVLIAIEKERGRP